MALAIYGWYLSNQVEKRFSARRWSIPSTVYSDTTLLYPGQRFDPALFKEKLVNLGYHRVNHLPSRKGEIRIRPDALDIFLNDLNDFAEVNEVYGSCFEAPYPVRETVEVSKLPKGVNVEISLVAMAG